MVCKSRHRPSLCNPDELLLEDAKQLVANGCIIVAEGANMPTTIEATEYLQKKRRDVSHLEKQRTPAVLQPPHWRCHRTASA